MGSSCSYQPYRCSLPLPLKNRSNKGQSEQSRRMPAVMYRRASSSQVREELIYLHSNSQRRLLSAEDEADQKTQAVRRSKIRRKSDCETYTSHSSTRQDSKTRRKSDPFTSRPPSSFMQNEKSAKLKRRSELKVPYQRCVNVYAAPLKHQHVEDFVAAVFPKNKETVQFLKESLSGNFVFSGLTAQEQMLLINAMQVHHFFAKTVIIKQGDLEDYFYIVRKGKVRFLIDSKKVREAADGVAFGELALLHNSPRAATVIAVTKCHTYRVDQRTFRTLLANNMAQLEKNCIELLKCVEIFKDIDTPSLEKIANALTQVVVQDGKLILRKGDVGKVFYIIQNGEVNISDTGVAENNKILKPGDYFGERALITREKRSANVTAIGVCTLLCISKETFEAVMGSLEDLINHTGGRRMLMNVPMFCHANLEPHDWALLSQAMANLSFSRGTILLEKGKPVINFRRGLYLVRGGEINISSSNGDEKLLRRGDTFGEDLVLKDESFTPSFTATVTEDAICNMLTVEDISAALGGLDRLLQNSLHQQSKLDTSVILETLKKIKILGEGTFGQVWLVRNQINKAPYALKIIDKRQVLRTKHVDIVIREKILMESLQHPFIITLVNSFQDNKNLFMLMEFIQGGELFSAIHTPVTDGISEQSSRFYAANIYDGLMYMHEKRILYRDLKPENVLIGEDGYCVLIDLGFAKLVSGKTYTMCGTPYYLAPEIILSRGYDKSVDNWSFGAVLFEMIVGYSPFYNVDQNQATLFDRIIQGRYWFPRQCKASSELKDLISKLLVPIPSKRLGSLAGGNDDIRFHPWLASLTRSQLMEKQIKPPWKPKLGSPMDSSNFDCFQHLENIKTPNYGSLTLRQQALFSGFEPSVDAQELKSKVSTQVEIIPDSVVIIPTDKK